LLRRRPPRPERLELTWQLPTLGHASRPNRLMTNRLRLARRTGR
jgi:hypothetical protein